MPAAQMIPPAAGSNSAIVSNNEASHHHERRNGVRQNHSRELIGRVKFPSRGNLMIIALRK